MKDSLQLFKSKLRTTGGWDWMSWDRRVVEENPLILWVCVNNLKNCSFDPLLMSKWQITVHLKEEGQKMSIDNYMEHFQKDSLCSRRGLLCYMLCSLIHFNFGGGRVQTPWTLPLDPSLDYDPPIRPDACLKLADFFNETCIAFCH